MDDLSALAIKHGADKGISYHGYTPYYYELLAPYRGEEITLVELGIFGGASMRMWREFFPRARVVGVDKDPSPAIPGVSTIQGNIRDPATLAQIVALGRIDVFVDDGSKEFLDSLACYTAVFPSVDLYYFVEDLLCPWWLETTAKWLDYMPGIHYHVPAEVHDEGYAKLAVIKGKKLC